MEFLKHMTRIIWHGGLSQKLALVLGLILIVVVTACDPNEEEPASPTPVEPTIAASPTPNEVISTNTPGGPTVAASATFPPTITPTTTFTPAPPSDTPGPTATPGPFEHVVAEGEDCFTIMFQYGVSAAGLTEFYDLNNMAGSCILSLGDTVLVPRPTPIPVEIDPNSTPITITPPSDPGAFGSFTAYTEYGVQDGDTLTSIALKNNTTLRRICQLNPLPDGMDCSGCDFSQSDVGFCPNPPLIGPSDCFIVPGPTPLPTGTLPPTGEETATPTPTHRAPGVVYPVDGSAVSGFVRLQWVSVGLLQPDEYYVVNLTDNTSGTVFIKETKSTYMDVPAEYAPSEAHEISWYVAVQIRNAEGLFVPAGDRTPDYHFIWQPS
jgi:hypothetical protein